MSTVEISAPAALGITDTQAWVHTPPGYAQHPERRCPVAHLLHATPGHGTPGHAAGGIAPQVDVLIAAHLVRPMLVAVPNTNGAGLRHPGLYGSITALEPYGDPGSDGRAAFPGDEAAFAAHSPSASIPTTDLPHPVSVLVDEGSRAPEVDAAGARLLVHELRARDQHVLARVERGHGHSWREADEGVPCGLVMASRSMPDDAG